MSNYTSGEYPREGSGMWGVFDNTSRAWIKFGTEEQCSKDAAFLNQFTVIEVAVTDDVLCDLCNGDYTTSDVSGGYLFDSKAVCPSCAPKFEENAIKYKEQDHITKRCPSDMSFGDWVRRDLR